MADNPKTMTQVADIWHKSCVWFAVIATRTIRPIFFSDTINLETDREKNIAPLFLNLCNWVWTAHTASNSMVTLSNISGNWIISCLVLSAHSLDQTPYDLCGIFKDNIYKNNLHTQRMALKKLSGRQNQQFIDKNFCF